MEIGAKGVDCEGIRDFMQYYRNAYFGWPVGNRIVPATFRGQDGDYITVYLHHADRAETTNIPVKSLFTDGIFGNLLFGNTPFKDTYAYLYNYGVRESAKGFRASQCACAFFDRQHTARIALNAAFGLTRGSRELELRFPTGSGAIDREVMNFLFNPVYPSFSAAIEELVSGVKLGVPINRDLGLYFKKGSEAIHVSFRTQEDVATVNDDGKLTVSNPRFRTLIPFIIGVIEGYT
jgi:hypothetical protein